jgi:Glyoxalase-like domain
VAVTGTMFVTLDCADARTLAEFWAAMLGGTIVFSTPRAVGVRSEAGRLAAMVVADYRPPTWPEPDVPKQIHLDLAVDDLDAAVAEAVRHGAVPAAVQPAPEARRILLDPAGHPFCLTTMIPRESAASPDSD